MNLKICFFSVVMMCAAGAFAQGAAPAAPAPTAAPATAKVSFVEPKDGATVGTPFHVKLGLEGMKVCVANKETTDQKCGHHHILVDGKPVAAGQVIPNDSTHLHYGKEQTEADLTLAPGKHTLVLQFADFAHRSFGEKMSAQITVTVK